VVALAIIVGLMLISILIALILCKKRKRERYVIKKDLPDDLELKVPLTCRLFLLCNFENTTSITHLSHWLMLAINSTVDM
jgi:hypothetical protein